MPDLPECEHSPLRSHPRIKGAALITGHKRYCDLIDPDHPDYNPSIAAHYIEMSRELMKPRKTNEEIAEETEPSDAEWAPGASEDHRPPADWPDLNEHKPDRSQALVMARDEAEHLAIYQAATNCPHSQAGQGCCGPYNRCGPDGVHSGEVVGIGVCYPCSAERLGIKL